MLALFIFMKKVIIIFLFVLNSSVAQENLVQNPSFKITNITYQPNCVFFTLPEYIEPWRLVPTPLGFKPFDSCSFMTNLRAPFTFDGYQEPHSGTSFITISTFVSNPTAGSQKKRSFIFNPLKKTLKKNRNYCFPQSNIRLLLYPTKLRKLK